MRPVTRQVWRWLGEFWREAAVLVGVLAPMELLIMDRRLTLLEVGLILAATTLCIVIGIAIGVASE